MFVQGLRRVCAVALLLCLNTGSTTLRADEPPARPNIVYILADDLGYGDVRAFNPDSKIRMPNLNRLAAEGRVFTDAHSGSAVCTPTRYGLLTGRYSWRTRLKQGVLGGYSPPLIEPGRVTVASLLKEHGYHTACFGKWHLGLDWPTRSPQKFGDAVDPRGDIKEVDYAGAIRNGPTTRGFDEFFGISASLDMPPYIFIENDHCVGKPTAERTYIRKGPAAPDFEAEDVLPILTRHAVAFLNSGRRRTKPFFLYLPLNAPHTPIVPETEYRGISGINPYADYVMQVDAALGSILEALAHNGQEKNTLLIVTSDNGCAPLADIKTLLAHGHNPSGPWRGAKADIFEGGHRMPFVARWPGKIPAGTRCDQTICHTDLLATAAALVGAKLPANAGEDSVNILPALLGNPSAPLREATVHHSANGSFAIRQGPWKLALCPDSGGWADPKPGSPAAKGLPPVQLYNLETDPGEKHNLQAERPEIVTRLKALLERYKAEGRSVPAPSRRS